ncbi:hypothetical protein PIB30_047952 [Stylosanthes scabra]|uniref:Pectinesterase inhibitor domain-containing protein n=1 Tax=Stylosanthes scabra TaxID=79078 RepID=A0ABU6YF60_9FABA|nr:hypothetical protein [Stylosanthes scabra]
MVLSLSHSHFLAYIVATRTILRFHHRAAATATLATFFFFSVQALQPSMPPSRKLRIRSATLFQKLVTDDMSKQALDICKEVLGYAVKDIHRSVHMLEKFEISRIPQYAYHLKIWIIDTLTHQETCLEAFQYIPTEAVPLGSGARWDCTNAVGGGIGGSTSDAGEGHNIGPLGGVTPGVPAVLVEEGVPWVNPTALVHRFGYKYGLVGLRQWRRSREPSEWVELGINNEEWRGKFDPVIVPLNISRLNERRSILRGNSMAEI